MHPWLKKITKRKHEALFLGPPGHGFFFFLVKPSFSPSVRLIFLHVYKYDILITIYLSVCFVKHYTIHVDRSYGSKIQNKYPKKNIGREFKKKKKLFKKSSCIRRLSYASLKRILLTLFLQIKYHMAKYLTPI